MAFALKFKFMPGPSIPRQRIAWSSSSCFFFPGFKFMAYSFQPSLYLFLSSMLLESKFIVILHVCNCPKHHELVWPYTVVVMALYSSFLNTYHSHLWQHKAFLLGPILSNQSGVWNQLVAVLHLGPIVTFVGTATLQRVLRSEKPRMPRFGSWKRWY